MGNNLNNESLSAEDMAIPPIDFTFHCTFDDDSPNGLCFNDHYLPMEVIWDIFSNLPPKELLKLTLVCKKWCNIIKSNHFWMFLYNKFYPNKAKQLPWYVYYLFFTTKNFDNLLKNATGEERFKHWTVVRQGGDKFAIESPPLGADNLPSGVKDFNNKNCCFATSFYECYKIQVHATNNNFNINIIIIFIQQII